MKPVFFILALGLFIPYIAGAQSGMLAPGARVRVTSPSDDLKRHVTTVTDVRGDSIVLTVRDSSRTIALANVTALDVSMGTQRRILRDGLIGLSVGAAAGAAIGAAQHEDTEKCQDFQAVCDVFLPSSPGESAALVGVAFGAAGLVAGVIVGALHQSDRWAPMLAPARAAVAPTRSGGVSLTLGWAF